jgi:hypothetical protein
MTIYCSVEPLAGRQFRFKNYGPREIHNSSNSVG